MIHNSNHIGISMISKGLLGNSYGLITKGILSNIYIKIITKGGNSYYGNYYDKDYWKRFNRDLKDKNDEIDYILVTLNRKYFNKHEITSKIIENNVKANLLSDESLNKDIKFNIKINLI